MTPRSPLTGHMRPLTLFTGQWADLPLETLAAKAKAWGYDGLSWPAGEIISKCAAR